MTDPPPIVSRSSHAPDGSALQRIEGQPRPLSPSLPLSPLVVCPTNADQDHRYLSGSDQQPSGIQQALQISDHDAQSIQSASEIQNIEPILPNFAGPIIVRIRTLWLQEPNQGFLNPRLSWLPSTHYLKLSPHVFLELIRIPISVVPCVMKLMPF